MNHSRSFSNILSRYKDFEERPPQRSLAPLESDPREHFSSQDDDNIDQSIDNSQFYEDDAIDDDEDNDDGYITEESQENEIEIEHLQNLRVDHIPFDEEITNINDLPKVQPIRPGKPPKSVAGLRILQSDLKDTNNRVHKLLIQLRMSLALKAGIPCSVLDNTLKEFVDDRKISPIVNSKDIISSASSLASTLKNQLERFVSAMATTFRPGDADRVYLGFVLLHRLLHPFSCDSMLTSKVLLIALAYQAHESKDLTGLFTDVDIKIITSRTIFISDPTIALAWNPLAQPMPLMPNVPNETVLSCLLRLYSIRRDVSSFFRMAWKQAIPSIVAIISTVDTIPNKAFCNGLRRETNVDVKRTSTDIPAERSSFSSHSFKNLLSVANRVLECVLREDIAQIFPTPARVICQSLFEVGGIDSLHSYILNLLILPNIIKLLRGDHESIENEAVHDKFSVSDLLNQYYNLDHWWPAPAKATPAQPEMISDFTKEPFNPVVNLIWLVWRLYSGATLLETSALEILTSRGFFAGGPFLDGARIPDQKIRNILVRLQHRADMFCKVLLQGFDVNKPANSVDSPRPKGMVNFSLMSKEEMAWISRDIYHELEVVCPDIANKRVSPPSIDRDYLDNDSLFSASPVTISLAQLLKSYISLDDYVNSKNTSTGEDFILLEFNPANFESDFYGINDSVSTVYDRLYRSLVVCSRYEDSLIRMIHAVKRTLSVQVRLEGNSVPENHSNYIDLQELIDDKSWFTATESSVDCTVREISLYDRHTETFRKKVKEPLYGLEPSTLMETDNQKAVPIIEDIQFKSRQSLHAEIHKALRFGTTKDSVATGSSIARPSHRVAKTKVNDDDFILGNRKPRYTKSVIHPASSLLIPTEANRRRNPVKRPNRFDLDKEFMESMRSHEVISTDKFLRKRESIARKRLLRRSDQDAVNNVAQPKPFPSYLRSFVRSTDHTAEPNTDINPNVLADMIIKDYKAVFASGTNFSPLTTISQQPKLGEKKVPIRSSRTPLPPDPIPGTSHLAPTQSLLNRCVLSKIFWISWKFSNSPTRKCILDLFVRLAIMSFR